MLTNQMSVANFKKYLREKDARRDKKKYKNDAKAKLGDTRFDSKFERDFGFIVEQMKQSGEIRNYQRQFIIDFYGEIDFNSPDLIFLRAYPRSFTPPLKHNNGKFMKITSYKVDFRLEHNDGSLELIECKGYETNDWKIKWALLSCFSGYKLTIIKQNQVRYFKSR